MIISTIHNSLIKSCSYLLCEDDSNSAYMIDCGDIEPVLEQIGNKRINGIFLTHCHFDHIYGINDFIKHFPDVKIYCHKYTFDGIKDERACMSYMYVDEFKIYNEKCFSFINEKTAISLFDTPIKILYTPGHDIDCLCFQINDSIFTGDSYNPYFPVYSNWFRSNKQEAEKNEMYLKQYIEKNKLKVFTGHYIE